jgi:hypothetical protein
MDRILWSEMFSKIFGFVTRRPVKSCTFLFCESLIECDTWIVPFVVASHIFSEHYSFRWSVVKEKTIESVWLQPKKRIFIFNRHHWSWSHRLELQKHPLLNEFQWLESLLSSCWTYTSPPSSSSLAQSRELQWKFTAGFMIVKYF